MALRHGGRRLQEGHGSPLDEVERVGIRDRVLEDLGGADHVSEVARQLVEDFAGAVVLRDLSFRHLAAVGPLTLKGRRRAVVGLYLEASARAERLASRIGLERRAQPVPTLTQWMESRGAKSTDAGSTDGIVGYLKDRKGVADA